MSDEFIMMGLAVIGIIGLYLIFYRGPKSLSLAAEFLLPESSKILATDLGGKKIGKPLIGSGVIGFCDAIFLHQGNVYACEYKSRKYRGQIRMYEYYQVILYAGLAKVRYRSDVVCRIKYKDHVVEFNFDKVIFDELIKLREECASAKQGGIKRLFNRAKPLHNRINVRIKTRLIS